MNKKHFKTKALDTLMWFITTNMQLTLKLRLVYRALIYIQKRFLLRYYTREAKLEILDNCWNKLCGKLNEENVGQNLSAKMSKMI